MPSRANSLSSVCTFVSVPVQIKALRKSVFAEEMITDLKVGFKGLSFEELAVKRLSGGIIQSQDKGIGFITEPMVERAVKEDHLAFFRDTVSAFSALEALFG